MLTIFLSFYGGATLLPIIKLICNLGKKKYRTPEKRESKTFVFENGCRKKKFQISFIRLVL